MTVNTPKAFISHSSVDKEIAEQLATDLLSKGIDAWFDKWEIIPGDSLRLKSSSLKKAALRKGSIRRGHRQGGIDHEHSRDSKTSG